MKHLMIVLALGAALALGACSNNDPAGPTPGGVNLLAGPGSGGTAAVVAITGFDSTGAYQPDIVYHETLDVDCNASWTPQGTLCNVDSTADDPDRSVKESTSSGATWRTSGSNAGATGVLVIDAGKVVDFSEARIFQMFSDGKTTQIQLAIHPATGDAAPDWNVAGWTDITGGFVPVGAGATADHGTTVTDPTVIPVGRRHARYLRVEVRNDGSLGDPRYIELRSLKLF